MKTPSQAFSTTIAGSLPKPAWLAETHKLWPKWRAMRPACADGARPGRGPVKLPAHASILLEG